MDIYAHIEKLLRAKKEIRSAEIVKSTGFSRAYVNKVLQEMQRAGKVHRVGKANQARYVPSSPKMVKEALKKQTSFHRMLRNENLHEDLILREVKAETGIFFGLADNVRRLVDYAFTEMLNNAIEHSRSDSISVKMRKTGKRLWFNITDTGIGIFKNIMTTRHLRNDLEAIQDLLKGKVTTDADHHSGEGIFFTSKAADLLEVRGSNKRLIFDNILGDVFIKDAKGIVGTRVDFTVSTSSARDLAELFRQFTNEALSFDKTKVAVDLYKLDSGYVSRSQARRILSGLEKFTHIILDFNNVSVVGQAFADEVFRVWKSAHPHIIIEVRNANENAQVMIQRATRRADVLTD
jgi:anti-sigma regulatory factor (Ser/Thr protein kinase)